MMYTSQNSPGMRLAPEAVMDDGKVDAILMRPGRRGYQLQGFMHLGNGSYIRHPLVEYRQLEVCILGLRAERLHCYGYHHSDPVLTIADHRDSARQRGSGRAGHFRGWRSSIARRGNPGHGEEVAVSVLCWRRSVGRCRPGGLTCRCRPPVIERW